MRKAILASVVAILLISSFPTIVFAAPPDNQVPISDFSSDQILVKFKPGTSLTEAAQIHRQLGGQVKETISGIGVQVVTVPKGKAKEKAKAYGLNARVVYAEPDFVAQALGGPDDPYLPLQWGLTKVEAPQAWEVTTGSPSINIAILDTGVDLDHPDLSNKVISSVDFSHSAAVDDVYGHGTHVAGIAAAMTNNGIGVAGLGYSCTIMNVKVLSDAGAGAYSWIASGIVWASDNGAEVINMSLGGSFGSSTLEDAVNYAWSKGVVVVAAAGNSGNTTPFYPAYYTNCIAVAATDANDARASWSNYGDWVDVAAPGVSIYSTLKNNGYGYKSGTSMASPHVAGLAALLLSTVTDVNGNGYLNDEVRSRIESTCDDIGIPGIGSGRINAARAVGGDDIVPQPDVQIVKLADPTSVPEANTMVTYTYTVTNTGDVTLTGIAVNDDKLGDIALASATLDPGTATTGTATYTVTQADIDSGADIVNIATVTTDQGVTAHDSASVTIEVPEVAKVTISPTVASGRGWPGEDVVYEFTVENDGSVPDTYDISVTSSWASSAAPQSVTLESAAAAAIITVTHSVPEGVSPSDFDTGTLEVVSGETGASASASFTTTARVSAVEITPGAQSGTGAPGETVQYTYTISNTGTEYDVYNLVVSAIWEASLSATSVSVEAGGSTKVVVSHTIVEGAGGGDSDTGTLTVTSERVSASATFTTTAQEEETCVPVVNLFKVSDTSNPVWARAAVEWAVSDEDGNLATVQIVMVLDGKIVDSATFSVGGYDASGKCQLRNRDGHGKTYDVTMIVTDTDGNTASKTESIYL